MTVTRSRLARVARSARRGASASIASPPAGSLPCWRPMNQRIGRPSATIAAASVSPSLVNTRYGISRPWAERAEHEAGNARFERREISLHLGLAREIRPAGFKCRRIERNRHVGIAGEHCVVLAIFRLALEFLGDRRAGERDGQQQRREKTGCRTWRRRVGRCAGMRYLPPVLYPARETSEPRRHAKGEEHAPPDRLARRVDRRATRSE